MELLSYKNQVLEVPSTWDFAFPWPCVLLTRLLCVIYLFSNFVFLCNSAGCAHFIPIFSCFYAVFFCILSSAVQRVLFVICDDDKWWIFYEARVPETKSAPESRSRFQSKGHLFNCSTHPRHSGERNSCALAASISGTHTCRRPVSGPTLSAVSSPPCPGDGSPGIAGRWCRCTSRPSVCGCLDAGSRTPVKYQRNNRKYLQSLAKSKGLLLVVRGFKIRLIHLMEYRHCWTMLRNLWLAVVQAKVNNFLYRQIWRVQHSLGFNSNICSISIYSSSFSPWRPFEESLLSNSTYIQLAELHPKRYHYFKTRKIASFVCSLSKRLAH